MFPRRGQGSGIIIGPAEPSRTRKESLTWNTARKVALNAHHKHLYSWIIPEFNQTSL